MYRYIHSGNKRTVCLSVGCTAEFWIHLIDLQLDSVCYVFLIEFEFVNLIYNQKFTFTYRYLK